MSVLVTNAHHRLAYYTARCLAKHSIEVTCASEFPLATCFFSRYCNDHFTYPSPWTNPDQFVEKIIEEIKKRDIEVLMPVHREGYVLAKYKDQLDQHINFPHPTYPQIIAVNDKARLIETANKAEIRIPETAIPNNLDQIEEIKTQLQFPVIIKLRQGHGGIGQTIVQNPTNLEAVYLKVLNKYKITKKEEYPIIQQYLPYQTISVSILFNHGNPRSKFGLFHPEADGIIRFGYYIGNEHQDAEETLCRLATHLNWHGALNSQFKLDPKGGPPYLLDINPRFSGSLGSAIMDGSEFPYLLYQIATTGDTQPNLKKPKNKPTRWLYGDLSNIPKYLKKGNIEQVLRILTCRATLDFWDPSDPVPFFILPIYNLTQLLKTGTIQPLIEKY